MWLPTMTRWFVKLAVRFLPEVERERWREEWDADLQSFPEGVSKCLRALDLIRASIQIGWLDRILRAAVLPARRLFAAFVIINLELLLRFLIRVTELRCEAKTELELAQSQGRLKEALAGESVRLIKARLKRELIVGKSALVGLKFSIAIAKKYGQYLLTPRG